jgi:hypothetical protein
MTPVTILLVMLIPAALSSLAVGLLSDLGLVWVAEVFAALARRLGPRKVALSKRGGAAVTVGKREFAFSWTELLPLAGGLVLAGVWFDPALSAWSVALGLTGLWVQRRTRTPGRKNLRATQEVFLNALRSRYAVTHSLTAALEGAASDLDNPEDAVVQAATETAQRLRAGVPVKEAMGPLATLGPVMLRLATILSRSDLAAERETTALLEELETQARAARRLAERASVILSTTRLTLRVLVAVTVFLAALSAVLPMWRDYYLLRPAAYAAATGLALGGYAYFAFKIKRLEESL